MKHAIYSTDPQGEPLDRMSPVFENEEDLQKWWEENILDENGNVKPEHAETSPGRSPCTDDGVALAQVDDPEAEAAADSAGQLVQNNKKIAHAVGVMLDARRMYGMAARELQLEMDKLEEEPHPMAHDFLVESIAYRSSQPFDSRELVASLDKASLPWVVETSATRDAAEKETREKAMAEADAARRVSTVHIGVKQDRVGEAELQRDKPLILVGEAMATQVLLDHVQNAAMTAKPEQQDKFTVVRLSLSAEELSEADPNIRLVTVPYKLWINSTRTAKAFQAMMRTHVHDRLTHVPDLLIVEELQSLKDHSKHDQLGRVCADIQKRVMEWCEPFGLALVAAVPIGPSSETPDLTHHSWERIRQFCTIRPVSVMPPDTVGDPDKRRILVGRDAFTLDVDKDLLKYPDLVVDPNFH